MLSAAGFSGHDEFFVHHGWTVDRRITSQE